jgi:hypothetical protein
MKISALRLAIVGSVVLASSAASADSVILRDGRHIRGKFSGGTQGVIAFSIGGTTQYYDVRNVLAMTFGEEVESQGNPEQEQVVPILPNNSYLRPNKTAPAPAPTSKVRHTNYVSRKAQTQENRQTLEQ